MIYKYPLAKDTITKEDIDVLVSWLSQSSIPQLTMGDRVKEFEKMWASYIGTKYAVFVNSGSSANLLMIYALLMSGLLVPGKSKIIVPAVGWGTTIAPIMQLGLIPIICDVDEETFGLDVEKVSKLIETDPDILGVFCVHALGVPCKILELKELCDLHQIFLLEDACASLGSKRELHRKIGSYGDMSSFSFYFGHQLSTIEGGMINTNDEDLYRLLLMSRSHGWLKDIDDETKNSIYKAHNIDEFHQPFTFFIPGFNLRGTDLQAVIGIEQVKRAESASYSRDANHCRYYVNLRKLKDRLLIQQLSGNRISSISFGAVCRNSKDRKSVVKALIDNGIETRLYSAGNLARHPFISNSNIEYLKYDSLAVSNKIHDGGFFLPNYPKLTFEEIDFICEVVSDSLK